VELPQTMVTWQGRPRELLRGSTSLWESPPVNPWDGMFGIFLLGGASLTMTPCTIFPFFLFFLNSPGPPLRSRSNSRCHRCLPGVVGTIVWPWF
jgi:hypothetical protein